MWESNESNKSNKVGGTGVRALAKDGTNRGGFRVGAGRKKKPLAEKIADGQASKTDAVVPVASEPEISAAIPEPRDFINTEQRGLAGVTNESRAIYDDTMKWLAERGCADIVPRGMVEKYAVATARWEQCDKLMSTCTNYYLWDGEYFIPSPASEYLLIDRLKNLKTTMQKELRANTNG